MHAINKTTSKTSGSNKSTKKGPYLLDRKVGLGQPSRPEAPTNAWVQYLNRWCGCGWMGVTGGGGMGWCRPERGCSRPPITLRSERVSERVSDARACWDLQK
jgi:hypothetical protein